MILFIFVAIVLISQLFIASTNDIIHEGEHGYSTYYEGTGPLIITSHHNGPLVPTLIPDRHSGCNWNGTHCIWKHNCSPQDSSNCGITTVTDSNTKDLAICIYNNVEMINNGHEELKAHLIINELRRTKLDPNRQIGEAAQGNNRAEQTWKEIHEEWANMAKQININNCGFGGLLIDIHGQSSNNYINLGYRLRTNVINLNDFELNDDYLDEISIKSLIINNEITISNGIRGEYSLGTFLTNYGYEVLPSTKYPTIPNDVTSYFAGATVSTLAIHGSQNTQSVTDAIQIEVNRDLRFDDEIRKQFCLDFSKAIVLYLNRWYDLGACSVNNNKQQSVGSMPDSNDAQNGFGMLTIGIVAMIFIIILSGICVLIKYITMSGAVSVDQQLLEKINKTDKN